MSIQAYLFINLSLKLTLQTLTGSDIPSWVNRLANMSGSLPFYDRWIPQEWLTPVALQQTLDEKNKESDASMNYPVAVGRDALEGYNSPGTSKRNSAAGMFNKVIQ